MNFKVGDKVINLGRGVPKRYGTSGVVRMIDKELTCKVSEGISTAMEVVYDKDSSRWWVWSHELRLVPPPPTNNKD